MGEAGTGSERENTPGVEKLLPFLPRGRCWGPGALNLPGGGPGFEANHVERSAAGMNGRRPARPGIT